MTRSVLHRTLLALVLLAGQMSAALCGVGHVHEAVAAEAALVHAEARAEPCREAPPAADETTRAHALDGYCHACGSVVSAVPAPGFAPVVRIPFRTTVAGAERVRPTLGVAREHRLARGPPGGT